VTRVNEERGQEGTKGAEGKSKEQQESDMTPHYKNSNKKPSINTFSTAILSSAV